jgi:hypothetical protein
MDLPENLGKPKSLQDKALLQIPQGGGRDRYTRGGRDRYTRGGRDRYTRGARPLYQGGRDRYTSISFG